MKDFTAFDNERKSKKVIFKLQNDTFIVEDDFNVMLKLMALQDGKITTGESINKMFVEILGQKQYTKLLKLNPTFETMMDIVSYVAEEIGVKVQGSGDPNATPSA